MCIIAIKKAGIDMIPASIMETMYENNSDGAGYMYAFDGKVHIIKGFMKYDALINSLDKLNDKHNLKDLSIVFHFRISTAGRVDGGNCHPFPVTDDFNQLRKTHVNTNLAMAHNGVIHAFSPYNMNDIYNDTQHFIASCVSYLYSLNADFLADERTAELFENIIDGSRLAFLDGEGKIRAFGDWIEIGGIMYSNTSYLPRKTYDSCIPIYESYNYSGYDAYYYDELEDEIIEELKRGNVIDDWEQIEYIMSSASLVYSTDEYEIYSLNGILVKLDAMNYNCIKIDNIKEGEKL